MQRLFVPEVGPENNLLLVINLINAEEEAVSDCLDPCSECAALILDNHNKSPH